MYITCVVDMTKWMFFTLLRGTNVLWTVLYDIFVNSNFMLMIQFFETVPD